MWIKNLQKLSLSFALLLGAAALLFFSEKPAGKIQKNSATQKKIAIFQYSSRVSTDSAVQGIRDALKENGFVDRENVSLSFFNSENDMPTASTIAKQITSGEYEMVITATTPCMQMVANANKEGKCVQVFGMVTDPFGAGVGLNSKEPLNHPSHIVGIGTFQPVEKAFRLAKSFYPELKKVGTVWNAAEACSEACTEKARAICKELGIELIEATVENSAGVKEAANALVARGAEALYLGGDSTVSMAITTLAGAAKAGRIPLFTNSPEDIQPGALFGLGADYYEVGLVTGKMAASVLKGANPADIPIEDVMPERLAVNLQTMASLKAPWHIPESKVTAAKDLIGPDGQYVRGAAQTTVSAAKEPNSKPARKTPFKVGLLYYGPDPGTDEGIAGFRQALADRGFNEGKNLVILQKHAQGEMVNIPMILQSYMSSDVDIIVPMTTPCLTATCAIVKDKPVVFAVVYDPVAAGAGTSFTEHLPNVTGVGAFPPINATIELFGKLLPNLRSVGTIYNASEANAVKAVETARPLFAARGIELQELSIASSNDARQAAEALISRGVKALWITGDNTALQAFDSIAAIAEKAGVPVIINDPDFASRGALAACGISFYQAGYEGGLVAADVLSGKKPAEMPLKNLASKKIVINLAVAARLKIRIPNETLKTADAFVNYAKKNGAPARLALIQLENNLLLDKGSDGVLRGLKSAGFQEGADFTVKRFNADGELSRLPLLMAAVDSEGSFELLVTNTTPAMIAAAKSVRKIPVVFTVSSNPLLMGVSKDGRLPLNMTGVYDNPPVAILLDMAIETKPKLKSVGTISNPAEPNSQLAVSRLRKACEAKNIKLYEIPISSVSEMPLCAQSLCEKRPEAIIVCSDNTVTTAFSSLISAAKKSNIPVYSTDPGIFTLGATAVYGADYGAWGEQAGRLAAKILAGLPPAEAPAEETSVMQKRFADDAVKGSAKP